jgi:hypothetical protein
MRASCDPAFCHLIDAGGDCEECWNEKSQKYDGHRFIQLICKELSDTRKTVCREKQLYRGCAWEDCNTCPLPRLNKYIMMGINALRWEEHCRQGGVAGGQ